MNGIHLRYSMHACGSRTNCAYLENSQSIGKLQTSEFFMTKKRLKRNLTQSYKVCTANSVNRSQ